MSVVIPARTGVGVSVTHDLSAAGRCRLDPRLDTESGSRGHGGVRHCQAIDRSVERRGRIGVANNRASGTVGHPGALGRVVESSPVVGRGAGFSEPPVRRGAPRQNVLCIGARGCATHDNIRGAHVVEVVTERINDLEPITMRGPRHHSVIDEAHRRCRGNGRIGSCPGIVALINGIDRGRPVVAVELVAQSGVVSVPRRGPSDPNSSRAQRHRSRGQGGVVDRSLLVRRRRLVAKTHQTLLCAAIDGREFPTEDYVLTIPGYRPGTLTLTGVGTSVDRREPVQQRGDWLVRVRTIDSRGRLVIADGVLR